MIVKVYEFNCSLKRNSYVLYCVYINNVDIYILSFIHSGVPRSNINRLDTFTELAANRCRLILIVIKNHHQILV
ncbi:hypothetical protein FMO003_28720 [Moritella sp. F3]|nr:hypothetical protein FMO001_27340 [Moritella sp. F1]GIC82591.1 hypothetical protein FMO003_28720 [Moritella sp. F3]